MSKSLKLCKWPGGKNFKTTSKFALVAMISFLACSCGQKDQPQAPLRSVLSLQQKAHHFQKITEQEFISPEGWLLYKKTSGVKGPQYGDLENQASLTAMQVLAELHRYDVAKDMDAIYNLNKLVGGLELLFQVTSLPGYPARAMAPSEEVNIGWKWHGVIPQWGFRHPMSKFHWLGDTSKEEFIYLTLALSEVCCLLDDFPEIKNRCRDLLVSMASFFLDNYQHVIGMNGQINSGGDLTGEIVVVPMLLELSMGYNHFISMALYTAAYDHCEDKVLKQRFKIGLDDMVLNGALNNLNPVTHHFFSERNYKNDNMAFMAAKVLLDSPSFPYKEKVLRSIRKLWMQVRAEKNIFWYLLVSEHMNEDEIFSDELIDDFKHFPDSKTTVSINYSNEHSLQYFKNKEGQSCAKTAPQFNYRPIREFSWSSDPYSIEIKIDDAESYAPVDFLVAYWMARSEGLILESP